MALGVGIQGIIIGIAPTVLIVAITALAAGQDESYLSWAVFAALIISGIATALQAAKIGRLGGGHVLIMGATPNFIAVSVLAIEEDGPAMLASLIVLSSLFYLALAAWLPLLRRIITPVVSGTVLMLIAAMILPIAFDRLQEVPEGSLTGGGSVRGRDDAGCCHDVDAARPPNLAAVVPAARNRRRLRGRGTVRTVRLWALEHRFLGWNPRQRIPGTGPDAERGVLGTAADVPDCDPRASDQGHRRWRSHSTGVAAEATNDRLSPNPRLNLRERGGRSAIGPYRDAAHDLLFVFYRLAHQPHRSLRAQRWLCRGRSSRGSGVLSQDNQRTNLHSQPGHGGGSC